MMECSIPVANGRVIFAERKLEVVVVVVAGDGSLHLEVVACWASRECHLAEIANFCRQRRGKVEIKLTETEAADGAALVSGGKIDVTETANLQRGIVPFRFLSDREV